MNQGEAIKALMVLAADNGVTVSKSKVKKTFVRLRDQAEYTDDQAYVTLGGMFLDDHSVFIVEQNESTGTGVVEREAFIRDDRAQWDNRLKAAGVHEETVKASREKWDANHPAGYMATGGRGPSAEDVKLDQAKQQVEAGQARMKKLGINWEES